VLPEPEDVDFHHTTRPVGIFAADRQFQQLVPQLFAGGLQLRQLGLRHLPLVGVVAFQHRLPVGDLAAQILEAAVLHRQSAQRTVLARGGRHPAGVRQDLRIRHLLLQFFEPGKFFFEHLAHKNNADDRNMLGRERKRRGGAREKDRA
jgi:hypothetical protein